MTQNDKQLLLIDLCARLPFMPKIKINYQQQGIRGTDEGRVSCDFIEKIINDLRNGVITDMQIYLRPMSNMTKEEKEELRQEQIKDEQLFTDCIKNHPEMRGLIIPHFAADWCDKNMFDYRGLIKKGLAIETPKGMYKEE